ncbi:MAG TPA: class A beta-lactamase [Rhizomicrobium sp.]|jgi:beta-lactamase class A
MPDDCNNERRALLLGVAGLLVAGPGWAADLEDASFREIEKRGGGRLGVAVLDTGTGRKFAYRGGERFAMCSTFKFLLVACVLHRVDAGKENLDREIAFGQSDMEDYAPTAAKHLTSGHMRLRELCEAAIVWSDNTAANLLLREIGGPKGWTDFARTLGDPLSRLDRTEPTLNTAIPGDKHDTTTPNAMLGDMHAVLFDPHPSVDLLKGWMIDCQTAFTKLCAGLPSTWRVGNKTGMGDNGTTNDIAILWPPKSAPILVTSYYTGSQAPAKARDAVHSEVGKLIGAAFG